ncbi:hypothetical protein [Paenibacillus polymyxa]|uniref:hypothetical protein n=1 Tax=Paenibacillus polymyxa TaxID=1406 RepID=UPI0039BF478F
MAIAENWDKILEHVVIEPNFEQMMLYKTIVRVHQHGTAQRRTHKQAIGRSRGEFITKIHAIVDALSNPLKFKLTPDHSLRQDNENAQGFFSLISIRIWLK